MSKKFSFLLLFIIFSTLSLAMESTTKPLFPEASPYSPELRLAPDGNQLLHDLCNQIGF